MSSLDQLIHPIVRRSVNASVEAVFAVLVDPETYPEWLYGARHIRDVDDTWPEPGSQFYHRVGPIMPVTIADSTEVLEIDPPHRLVMEVRFRPLGWGEVTFTLRPAEPGSSADGEARQRAEVVVQEKPKGPLTPLAPLFGPAFALRNVLSLRALDRYLRRQPVTNRTR